MNTWIQNILNKNTRVAIPVMTHPGIEAIGCTVHDAITNSEVHCRAVKHIADHYPIFASTTIMDLTVEAEAFGSVVNFSQNEIPTVVGRLVYDENTVNELHIPNLDTGRLAIFLEAADRMVNCITDKPVFAGCTGPFSLAGRLFGMSEIMLSIYIEPQVVLSLLDKCIEFLIRYCSALKRTGVTGVFIAEPAAGLLSNEDCMTFSSDYIRKLVDILQDDDFSIILHNCGNTGQCTQAMIDSDAAALHFGNAINMLQVLENCPNDRIVMGNIDPVGIMKQAHSNIVKSNVMKLLEDTSYYQNFVLSTGCDVPPKIPKDNIEAFFEALNTYNKTQSINERLSI